MIDLNNELGVELTRPGLLQLVPQGQVTCHSNNHMMCQTAELDFGNKGVGIMIRHPGMVGRSGCQARKKKRNPSKSTSRELPESQKMPGGSLEMSRRISDCATYLLVVNYLAVALVMSILSIWVKTRSCLTSFQQRSLTHYGKVSKHVRKG